MMSTDVGSSRPSKIEKEDDNIVDKVVFMLYILLGTFYVLCPTILFLTLFK